MKDNQEAWKKFLQSTEGGAKLAASGVTGKSAERLSALQLAEYLRGTADRANELTKAKTAMDVQVGTAAAQARADQFDMFSKVAFTPNPQLEPPKPVLQSVAAAAFTQALGMFGGMMGMMGGAGAGAGAGGSTMVNGIPTLPSGMTDWSKAIVIG